MPQYLVAVVYHENKPRMSPWSKFYLVEAKNVYDARRVARELHGYDPGVPVEVTETPINENKTQHFLSLGGRSH
jgi:hypothetical protein